jgi:hypothetical protein
LTAPLEEVLAGPASPLALSRLLAGRDNAERERAGARYRSAEGIPFSRHGFAPLDTSHTPRDALDTLEPDALDRVSRAREAAIAGLR